MNTKRLVLLGLAALLVSACGSGSDDAAAPVPPVAASDKIPDAVGQSADGMASWITQLAAEDTEAKDALDVARFTPPTTDNTEPLALK